MSIAITNLRWAQLLKRSLAIKTDDPGKYLTPVVGPAYEMTDSYKPEDRMMRGERVWGICSDSVQTAATNFTFSTWVNPQGSGRLVVVRRFFASGLAPTNAQQTGRCIAFVRSPRGSPGGVSVQGLKADGRENDLTTSNPANSMSGYNLNVTLVGSALNAFLVTCLWAVEIGLTAATAPFSVQSPDLDVVLPPACGLQFGIFASANATTTWSCSVGVNGYERVVDPGELIVPP